MLAAAPRKFWFAVALIFFIVGGFGVLGMVGLRTVRLNAKVLAEARKELAVLELERKEIFAAERVIERLEREQSFIAASFANPADPLPFIQALEGLGRRSGLKLDLALASGVGPARSEAYVLSTTGTFPAIVSFFKSLESLPFLIQVGNAELVQVDAGVTQAKSGPLVRLAVTIRIITP